MDFKRQKIDILGVDVDDISQKDAVKYILEMAKDKKDGHFVVTVNSEIVMLAVKNADFKELIGTADLAVADSVGVVISKLIFGGKEHDRITGADLLNILCRESVKRTVTVGFLGGFGNVAEVVAKRQKEKNPGLDVAFAGPGDDAIGPDLRLNKEYFGKKRVDILFVAYGMGRQEFLIKSNLKRLNVGVFIGVGGALDYASGVKKRAPKAVQTVGLEWLWRLVMEPRRIWRMRVLPVFFAYVVFKKVS